MGAHRQQQIVPELQRAADAPGESASAPARLRAFATVGRADTRNGRERGGLVVKLLACSQHWYIPSATFWAICFMSSTVCPAQPGSQTASIPSNSIAWGQDNVLLNGAQPQRPETPYVDRCHKCMFLSYKQTAKAPGRGAGVPRSRRQPRRRHPAAGAPLPRGSPTGCRACPPLSAALRAPPRGSPGTPSPLGAPGACRPSRRTPRG